MTTIGGPKYQWRGKDIRIITSGKIDCVALPRKESYIIIPVSDVQDDSVYRVLIYAKNSGGNGGISIGFAGNMEADIANCYTMSQDFKEFCVNVGVKKITSKTNMFLRIARFPKSSGNVMISKITYEKIGKYSQHSVTALPVSQESAREKYSKAKAAQKNIIQNKTELAKKEREKKNKEILDARSVHKTAGNLVTVGGKGFKWKGARVKEEIIKGQYCVRLTKGSMLLIPASIVGNTLHNIKIVAANQQNAGQIAVNFFGNAVFNGKSKVLNIKTSDFEEYDVEIPAPAFPSGMPAFIKIISLGDENKDIFIKCIQYRDLKRKESRLQMSVPLPPTINIPTKKLRQRVAGDSDMSFKPYIIPDLNCDASKVLMTEQNQAPKVSIITPTRDGLELIKKCYDAIKKNTSYPNWEWIVGDSCSSDGTIEYLNSLNDPHIKAIQRNTLEGSFSSINNELVKHSDGEFILFLNNDTQPQPFWLFEMMSKINQHPEIGIVGSKLLYSPGRIQHAGVMFIPDGPANIGKSVLGAFAAGFADHDRFYQAVSAACLLIRREDFDLVGGFDPVYYFCYEDIDLCLKVREQLKKKVLYSANSNVFHSESVTQNIHKTAGVLQKQGIEVFKKRWMHKIELDFDKHRSDPTKGLYKTDISFITCITNARQYSNFIAGSLFKNKTQKNYELIPIFNYANENTAPQALNAGIARARGNIVVACHQDVVFYENWIELLFKRIGEVEAIDKKWGVIGTAGITTKDTTIGIVRGLKGKVQWASTVRKTIYPVQTVDEHCMILNKKNKLLFDEQTLPGFHFYGPDLCLTAMSKGLTNYGILCPLVHDSSSASLGCGKAEFMKLLGSFIKKWKSKYNTIRTSTTLIRKGVPSVFVKFAGK